MRKWPVKAIILGVFVVSSSASLADSPMVSGNTAPRVDAENAKLIEAERIRLFSAMMADPSNLDIAFRYAEISSLVGDIEGALATLERMLIFAPGLPRLQLELGVLYFRLGAYDTARTYFDAALRAPNVPPEVQEKVATYLSSIQDLGSGDQFSGTILSGLRWQSNANAGPQSQLVRTTLLSEPLLLDRSALGEADINGFVASNFRFSHDLASQGDRLEAGLQTYGALYGKHDEINTGFAELTFGPTFNLERFSIKGGSFGVYGILGGILLGGDPYLLSGGVGVNLVKLIDERTRLDLRAEYRSETFEDSDLRPTSSQRDGDRIRATAGLQYKVNTRFSLFGSVGAEHREADHDELSFTELGFNLGASLAFQSPFAQQADPWTVSLAGGYVDRDYDRPDPVFDLTHPERDEEIFVESSLIVPIKNDWAFQGVVGYRDVQSNYDMRRYDNVSASVGVLKRF